jgi:hypothetical protein
MTNKLLVVIAINLTILTGLMIMQAVPTADIPLKIFTRPPNL